MKRFLTRERLEPGARASLGGEEARHALKSLRIAVGEHILLADGQGMEAEAKVTSVGPEGLEAEILHVRKQERATRIELVQAVLKGPKMDWLVEKLTEMGVSALYPALSKRTVATGDRTERWERIARSALKQSGNLLLPEIQPLRPLPDILPLLQGASCFYLQPGAREGLAKAVGGARSSSRIALLIGPEGGFSPEEEEMLDGAGISPAALSHQVLRGETAALAALAIATHSIDF